VVFVKILQYWARSISSDCKGPDKIWLVWIGLSHVNFLQSHVALTKNARPDNYGQSSMYSLTLCYPRGVPQPLSVFFINAF